MLFVVFVGCWLLVFVVSSLLCGGVSILRRVLVFAGCTVCVVCIRFAMDRYVLRVARGLLLAFVVVCRVLRGSSRVVRRRLFVLGYLLVCLCVVLCVLMCCVLCCLLFFWCLLFVAWWACSNVRC